MSAGNPPHPAPGVYSIDVGGFRITRRGRFWSVWDSQGQLVCLTVYKKGALEVVRRLLPPELRPLVDGPEPGAVRPSPKMASGRRPQYRHDQR
jgi:hypothetical protein